MCYDVSHVTHDAHVMRHDSSRCVSYVLRVNHVTYDTHIMSHCNSMIHTWWVMTHAHVLSLLWIMCHMCYESCDVWHTHIMSHCNSMIHTSWDIMIHILWVTSRIAWPLSLSASLCLSMSLCISLLSGWRTVSNPGARWKCVYCTWWRWTRQSRQRERCVAACCSVLQRVAACCSVLQCVVVCCSVRWCIDMRDCCDSSLFVPWHVMLHTIRPATFTYVVQQTNWDVWRNRSISARPTHPMTHSCVTCYVLMTHWYDSFMRDVLMCAAHVEEAYEAWCSVLQCVAVCCSAL